MVRFVLFLEPQAGTVAAVLLQLRSLLSEYTRYEHTRHSLLLLVTNLFVRVMSKAFIPWMLVVKGCGMGNPQPSW